MENLVVYGDNLINVTKQVFNCVKENYDKYDKHIIIVPDKFTMLAEQWVLRACDKTCSFKIEVLTASRLANLLTGGNDSLSKQGGIMLIRKLCAENANKLQFFSALSNKFGFAEIIYDTIMQLKSCKITPYQLESKGQDLTSKKIADIKVIFELYEEAVKNKFIDSSERLELLKKSIKGNAYLKNCAIYYTKFDTLTEQAYDIIEQFVKCGNFVVVGGVCSKSKLNSHIYENVIVDRVKEIFRKYGSFKTLKVSSDLKGDFLALNERLFSFAPMLSETSGDVHIWSSANEKQELERVAVEIRRGIVSYGKRFKDFAILLSSFDDYKQLKSVFDKYEIKTYFDKSENLIHNELSKFILSIFECVARNYLPNLVIGLVKNVYFGLSEKESFAFEDFLNRYNFFGEWFVDFRVDDKEVYKQEIESVISKLKQAHLFFEYIKQAVYGEQFIEIVKNILAFFETDKINQYLCESIDDIVIKNENSQVVTKINAVLDEISKFASADKIDSQTFIDILSSGLNASKISTVPLATDGVFIGDQTSEFDESDTLFVLGATSGALPSVLDDCGIITDKEINELSVKFFLSPKTSEITKRNKYRLFENLLMSKHLFISYPVSNSSGDGLKVAPIVESIRKVLSFEGKPLTVETLFDSSFLKGSLTKSELDVVNASAVGTRQNAIFSLLKSKENILLTNSIYDALKKENADKIRSLIALEAYKPFYNLTGCYKELYFKNNKTSISALQSYFDCPFKFFVERGLKVKPLEKAEIKSLDSGKILHRVAELYAKMQSDDKNNDEKVNQMIDSVFMEFSSVINVTQDKSVVVSLRKEAMRVVNWLRYYERNTKFECKIFPEYGFNGIEIGYKNKVNLTGVIDRVDTFEDRCIIIDYKSGKQNDKYNVNEIYCGKKVQILVYAYVAKKVLNVTPIAFGLMPIDDEYDKVSKKHTIRGLYTNNVEQLKELDIRTNEQDYTSDIFDFKINSGKLSANCFSQAVLDKLYEYVITLCGNAVDEICEGYIDAKPVVIGSTTPCTYCEFASICKHSLSDKKRVIKKVKLENFVGVNDIEA